MGAPPLTPPAVVGPSTYPAAVPHPSPYAGFWLRFVAYIIDSAIILFGAAFIILIAVAVVGVGFFRNLGDQMDSGDAWAAPFVVTFFLMLCFFFLAAAWLYYAWFESSQHQGTLGKIALGLIVTDMEGRSVTFARATGRYFAKMITGLIPFFIGYIMAGFTERKQALHDMIAACLVLRRL